MNSAESDADDPFEEQREAVENPMKRLFLEYGSNYTGAAVIGIVASFFARILDLLPALMLGVAIDAVIRQDVPYVEAFPVGGGSSHPPSPRDGWRSSG